MGSQAHSLLIESLSARVARPMSRLGFIVVEEDVRKVLSKIDHLQIEYSLHFSSQRQYHLSIVRIGFVMEEATLTCSASAVSEHVFTSNLLLSDFIMIYIGGHAPSVLRVLHSFLVDEIICHYEKDQQW